MLIHDRVLCDECLCVMGQLHHQPASQSDFLADHGTAPHYAQCPDCQQPCELSEPAALEQLA